MKRNIYFITIFFINVSTVFSQQDSYAKKILDAAANKVKSYSTIQADFIVEINDRKEDNVSTSEGFIKLKGEKYYVETLGNQIFFDGKTMWSYSEELKEVTITEPDSVDDDFINNPAKILTWYNRDFKYRYVRETTKDNIKVHEIDLFPNNLDQPYSRIKLFLNVNNSMISMVSTIGKDGVDYNITLTNYKLDKEINDSNFTFDVNKHKKVEVIDLRF